MKSILGLSETDTLERPSYYRSKSGSYTVSDNSLSKNIEPTKPSNTDKEKDYVASHPLANPVYASSKEDSFSDNIKKIGTYVKNQIKPNIAFASDKSIAENVFELAAINGLIKYSYKIKGNK